MIKQLAKVLLIFCILGFQNIKAQATVSGTIKDGVTGMTLPGATILVKGTKIGASTDMDGKYNIQVQSDNAVLQFSFMGYESSEIAVKGKSVINISLNQSAESLTEVVVTALGIKRDAKSLGYSITEVKGDAVSQVKQTNAINGLQGKIAGVNITGNSTGAAGSSRVIIRGNTSLTGNNQPLYIIDGMPMGNDTNGSAGTYGGSDGGDGISSINPDEIASISVLKGGAAAALYGSRAANGVIMITTKSGKNQKGFGVEFSSSLLFDKVNSSMQDFQTEYGQGTLGVAPTTQAMAFDNPNSSWGAKLDGSDVVNWDGVVRPYSYVGNNLDKFYDTAATYINTISISNSNEKSNYRFSISDLSNADIVPNSGLNRKTFSLNLGSVLADKLTLSTNIKYIRENTQNRPRLSDSPGNANYSVAVLPANIDVTTMDPGANEDGSERATSTNIYATNPYWAAYNFKNEDQKNRIIGSASLKYDILDWLYVSARSGIDEYSINTTFIAPWGTAYQLLGSMYEQETKYSQIDSDIMIGVNRKISNNFSTNSLIGASNNTQVRETLTLSGSNFIVPDLQTVKNTENQSTGYQYSKQKMSSIYGSFEFDYKQFIYLTFTARNDWFSTLSAANKTTPNNDLYTSINTSIILNEAFKLPEWIDFAKLRAGYSELAGGAPDPYSLSLSYGIVGQGHLGQSLSGISNGTIPNANLVPYNVDEVEFGLDTRLFGGKLSLDLAYYAKKTTKDIVSVSASQASGYSSSIANLGEITNKGFEMLISGDLVRTQNFRWTPSFNFAYNIGKVVATNATNSDINLGQARTQNVQISHIVGQPYGVIYGTSYARTADGEIIYEIDSDGVPRAKDGGNKQLGQGVPPYSMGLTNSFSYKNFSASFLIDAKFGGQIYSGTNAGAVGRGQHKVTLEGREDGLVVNGIDDATGLPFTATVAPQNLATYWGRISGIAEEFVEDADYIKFRQISIGYDIPIKALNKTFLTSANVSLIGRNLFYINRSVDNIDPESAYSNGNAQGLEYYGLPSTRSYGVSLNVKF
ncbi:SusC/RagA family TonB-linked outer membrane protein [Flavobacterium algicola]|uniref:SusC/RagA family TonB-linked outer membrane protein n=1 Tax=Flavobacterium algicola TaxID=556529 RepID=UPI001EFD5154|nr:SusC/RagA family TonB-linked outer membrane protein [Flavobacterium algicola]MCG9792266.1 SusC/RagA family TonB-linked outer membrane protein [Flavobacterium algicola]